MSKQKPKPVASGDQEKARPSDSSAELVAGEIVRLGKDEMNLVEYPFAVLWKGSEKDAIISSEWETRHPISGKMLKAKWCVLGHPQMGLPRASDELVYLVLMELTREAGMQRTVFFSRYDLLKRLGWRHDPPQYRMLDDAFKRLQSVKIQADNAYWSAKDKSFRNVGFSLIEVYDLQAEKPGRKSAQSELPVSYFTWNEVIFASFQEGYLKSLDLNFALALKGDLSLRLYRYLDKKSYDGRPDFEIELEALCARHLGMKPAPYPSKLKERLKPAHDELMARGFLSGFEYEPMKTRKGEKVRYLFAPRAKSLSPAEAPTSTATPGEPNVARPAGEQLSLGRIFESASPSPASRDLDDLDTLPVEEVDLLSRLLGLKISPEVARELLRATPPDVLRLQLDCLADRGPKDPAAVLVKALRQGWEAPAKYLERVGAQERAEIARTARESAQVAKAAQKAATALKTAFQEQKAAEMDALWEKLDVETQKSIDQEAVQRLGVLGTPGRAQAGLLAMRRALLRERADLKN